MACHLFVAKPLTEQRLTYCELDHFREIWSNYSNRHSTKKIENYNGVIMGTIASQITSLTIVYSIVYSEADQRKHQSSASLAFVRGIHLGPVNYPHKWPVTRKIFPFDDVIMKYRLWKCRPFFSPGYSGFGTTTDDLECMGVAIDDTKPDGSYPGITGWVITCWYRCLMQDCSISNEDTAVVH